MKKGMRNLPLSDLRGHWLEKLYINAVHLALSIYLQRVNSPRCPLWARRTPCPRRVRARRRGGCRTTSWAAGRGRTGYWSQSLRGRERGRWRASVYRDASIGHSGHRVVNVQINLGFYHLKLKLWDFKLQNQGEFCKCCKVRLSVLQILLKFVSNFNLIGLV